VAVRPGTAGRSFPRADGSSGRFRENRVPGQSVHRQGRPRLLWQRQGAGGTRHDETGPPVIPAGCRYRVFHHLCRLLHGGVVRAARDPRLRGRQDVPGNRRRVVSRRLFGKQLAAVRLRGGGPAGGQPLPENRAARIGQSVDAANHEGVHQPLHRFREGVGDAGRGCGNGHARHGHGRGANLLPPEQGAGFPALFGAASA